MISVCIATYNGERFIREQIGSIINQLGNEDEIIISDNGSTDSTIDIIKEIDDKRIKLIKGPEKKSPTSNFENALMHAKGEYIFLSDQDDVWKDNKISICMQYLKHYDCVISDAEMVDENLNIIEKSYYKVHNTKQSRIYNTLIKNGHMGCCMAFTKRVLKASLPFPKDIPMHDIWIGNIAAYRFNVKFIPNKLIQFRCHGRNSSFTASVKSGNSLFRMLMIRWTVIKCLSFKFIFS